ncbi:MAG TPA: nucleoside hydrolase, partial [Gemmatimonadaceae bacterium]
MPTSILIDTDPGIDDAVAIALAAKLPELRIVAITTVHGNSDVDRTTRNARLIASRAGLSLPIIAGAAAPLVR